MINIKIDLDNEQDDRERLLPQARHPNRRDSEGAHRAEPPGRRSRDYRKAGWDGESAALAVGLTIAPTGEHIRSAKAFGIGFHDNSWTFAASKLWGGKEGYKIALNLKDMTTLSFPGNLMYTTYINSDEISWYAYKSVGQKVKLNKSEHEDCDIKKFCVRASVQLVDAKTARISYGIVPVSLEELKREYLEHMGIPGFPNILYQRKDIPFLPLAEEDWELPS